MMLKKSVSLYEVERTFSLARALPSRDGGPILRAPENLL
jgi:hypothetical protein